MLYVVSLNTLNIRTISFRGRISVAKMDTKTTTTKEDGDFIKHVISYVKFRIASRTFYIRRQNCEIFSRFVYHKNIAISKKIYDSNVEKFIEISERTCLFLIY